MFLTTGIFGNFVSWRGEFLTFKMGIPSGPDLDNRRKIVTQQYLLHMSQQYGELRPTSSWDRSGSLGHPCRFQRVSRLGSITARHCSSGRQSNFAALNRWRHLYSVGRPSRWVLAHISSLWFIDSGNCILGSICLFVQDITFGWFATAEVTYSTTSCWAWIHNLQSVFQDQDLKI